MPALDIMTLSMKQETREKIALVVFLALIAGTLLGVGMYLRVGHSWNHAATSIDDARGDMEGYSAIVFRGVNVPSSREAEAMADETPVPITAVVRSYREKGALVLRLDVLHPEKYDGEDIFLIGHSRVGVFYAPSTMTPFAIERRIAWYRKHSVDYTICIAEKSESITRNYEGLDMVLALHSERNIRSGTVYEGMYYVESPVVGHVGAVLVSPNGIVSSKEIDEIPE